METIRNILGYWGYGAAAAIVLLALVILAKNFLYICRPNQVLIFAGGKHKRPDGTVVGYRVIFGGHAWRIPVIETVQRMDMRTLPVEVLVTNAYSKVGIPLNIRAVANVKISSNPDEILNAIERFLGKPSSEVRDVAKETLEGNLRGVLATLTPEEVNEDRLKFAESMQEEAEHDFKKLGLMIDTLKIQHVTDEVNYLNSIGRKSIAEIIRDAEIAESNCMRDANKVAADAEARAKIARADSERHIVQARNDLRRLAAELEARARSKELEAEAQAQQARAEAEQELQQIRTDLEARRLEADVVVPADIDRQARQLLAAGDAAPIVEDGNAIAEATRMLGEAWAEAGPAARDIYVLANLDKIADKVAEACRGVRVEEVQLVDDGSGETIPRYAAAYPNMVAEILRSVGAASGVDVLGSVAGTATVATGEEG